MKKNKKNDVALEPIAEADRVPLKEKLAYGIGGLMDGGGVSMMSCVMLAYMTKNGIAMTVASTIMMLAKLWDAITDPFMGFISDNTRGKWGRRKPYMFFGGISLFICIFFVFLPAREWGMSVGGFTAYIIILYLIWNTCSTVTQVPYCSMASDITPSFRERNNANTVKLVFTAIASGLGYVLPLVFIEALTNPDGTGFLFMPQLSSVDFWLCMSIIFGTLFGGGLVICGIFVKERINPKTPKQRFNFKQFVNSYAIPYKNRSYRWHIVMYVTAFMCMDIISALAVYYATDVWHGYELFGMKMSSLFIIAPLMVAAVVMFPLARVMMDKKSKQFAFRMGLPFYIGGGIMLAVMDPSWAPPILVPIVALIMGLGFGGAQMMPWIIFPDTVDVAAYIPQSDKVLLTIRLVLGISVAVFITVALIASFRYKINSTKLTRIRYFIEARKSGKTLTDEESKEREALVAELYGKVNLADIVEIVVTEEDKHNAYVEGVESALEEISENEEELAVDGQDVQNADETAQNDVENADLQDKTAVDDKE